MAGTVPVATSLEDIYTPDAVQTQGTRWDHLLSTFKSTYGHSASFVSRSPGRVNIIGEHIDYSLYPVLPMAITADALLAVSCSAEAADSSASTFKIKISNLQDEKFPKHEFDIPYDNVEIDATVHEWTNYFKCGLRGALLLLKRKYGNAFRPKGMNVLMDGTVPAGGGLSSSAAFVSASALAVMIANGEKDVDKTELTEVAIVSERAVGVNSGGPVDFPKTQPELAFLIAQSFVTSNKQVTGPVCYNLRVVECSLAAAYLHAAINKSTSPLPADNGPLGVSLHGFGSVYFKDSSTPLDQQLETLVEITKSTLRQEEGYTRQEIAQVLGITISELQARYESSFPIRAERFKLRQRALHVFSEGLRVQKFLTLLSQPTEASSTGSSSSTEVYNKKLGNLMNDTQDSCRDLYECSCPEIDDICAIARRAGSYGSRLTGAGWGGCSVHLVPVDKVEAVEEAWQKEYYSKLELTAEQKDGAVVVSRPGGGSAVLLLDESKLASRAS
ncbi:MAG: galactokinase [Claussenomyces sp. TS43310]|nr:MAG: galactokinase [Claussenomyces sp. TS43310]